MDAVKFFKEHRRMCDSHEMCETCPFHLPPDYYCLGDVLADSECEITERAVSIVEKWSAEHPVKTRLQDFLEKYPEAMLRGGLPLFLPYTVGYCGDTDEVACGYCMHCSRNDPEKCWNLPLEE